MLTVKNVVGLIILSLIIHVHNLLQPFTWLFSTYSFTAFIPVSFLIHSTPHPTAPFSPSHSHPILPYTTAHFLTLVTSHPQIWMLTGDKLETATCIAKSSRLVSPNQGLHIMGSLASRREAHLELNALRRKSDSALIIKVNGKAQLKVVTLQGG